MKKIILGIIISLFLFSTSHAGLCVGFGGYLYTDSKTKENLILEKDKLSVLITKFPVSTFDTEYIRSISDCEYREMINLKRVKFSNNDYITIIINLIFYIIVLIIFPLYLSKKSFNVDYSNRKNIIRDRLIWYSLLLFLIILFSFGSIFFYLYLILIILLFIFSKYIKLLYLRIILSVILVLYSIPGIIFIKNIIIDLINY